MTPNATPRELFTRMTPSLLAAGIAWGLFVLLGSTPPMRAAALASVIGVIAFALRPMGTLFAVVGALVLAITPAYWGQTGGIERVDPLWVIGALVGVGIISTTAYRMLKSATWAAAIGGIVLISAVLFAQMLGWTDNRSLRLTTLLSALLLALLTDLVWRSNPRADSPPMRALFPSHIAFLLVTFALGIVNDPMITLFAPAIVLAIMLTRMKLSPLAWGLTSALIVFGAARLIDVYGDLDYWLYPASAAIAADLRVPFVIGGAWREPARWISLIGLLANQFTIVGVALALVGLARLSRWHPPVGTVTLVAFGTYGIFGLIYFGADATVLLLPLMMIQTFWITYALAALRDWILKIASASRKWRSSQNPV